MPPTPENPFSLPHGGGFRIGNPFSGISSAVKGGMEWWNKKNYDQMPNNPYMGAWGSLISQLGQQARGQGPSLAGNAYKQAHGQAINDALAMGRGGSAGAVRASQNAMGRANQGLAAGYSNVRLQEQMAARQQLQAALAGAGNAWFQPMYANMMAKNAAQSNGQKFMGFLQQGAATLAGIPGLGGGGQQQQQWIGPPGGDGQHWA